MRSPSLPQVWGLNQILLTRPVELESAVEHLRGLPYHHLAAEGDEAGQALVTPLLEQGFKLERELVMAIAGGHPTGASHATRTDTDQLVIEPGEGAMVELERRWLREDERITAVALDQVLEATLREGRAWNERRFAIAAKDGGLAAMTKLRSDGQTAQVEDVYTVPEARGRGFASSLVTHAVAEARRSGHSLVFIVADDFDWPKQLYARLGFEAAGRRWVFHKDLHRAP